jgi:hypothetical protein
MGFWGKSIDKLETTELKKRISKHITFVNNFYKENQAALEAFANSLRAEKGLKNRQLPKQAIIFNVKGQLSDLNNSSTQILKIPDRNDTEKNDCDSLIKELDYSINATKFDRDKKANKFTYTITDREYVTYENLKVILEFAIEIYELPQSTDQSTGGKRRRRSTKKRKSSKKSRKARRSRRHRRNRSSKK